MIPWTGFLFRHRRVTWNVKRSRTYIQKSGYLRLFPMGFDGGCACGALRYQITGSPFCAVHCHCESCRKATGSPMTSYFGVSRAQVAWNGARSFYNSSRGVTRAFCGQCGTPMHYMNTRWPGEMHLFAATLDELTLYKPTAHVHWAERVPWLILDDGLPKYNGRAS